MYESSDGSAIQDASVYLMTPDTNYGSIEFTNIGFTGIGPSSTAVWLKGLGDHSIYRTLDAEEIVSVKLKYRTKNQTDPIYINLYRISENVSWTESTVTYNNVGAFDTSVNKGATVYSDSWNEFDITSFAKGWKNYSYNNTMRVIFTSDSPDHTRIKQFYSSEYSANTGYRPYVIFTYQLKNLMNEGTYYIRNKHIDRFLQPTGGSTAVNTGLELNAFTGNNIQKWIVTSNGNGFYTIKNAQSNYVLSVPYGQYSTYDVQLTQAVNLSLDGQQWRIYMTSYSGFAIKPKSACEPNDGSGWSDRTMSVADGNDGNGALVTQRPYVYNNSFKDEWYLIPTDVPGSTELTITNKQLETNVQPYGGIVVSNNSVVLWAQTLNDIQKWNFTSVGGGYYKISPKGYSSYALSVASGSETAENGTVRIETYTGNIRQQWFIYRVANGYVLKARSSGYNNFVLSVSEGNLGNGAIVSQRAYVNNLSYKEEWFLLTDVLLESGIYSIKNINSNLYFETGAFSIQELLPMRQYSKRSTANTNYLTQLWRINHVSDGEYLISPYYYNNAFLSISNGSVVLSRNASSGSKWSFEIHNDYVTIRNVLTSQYIQIENNSVSNYAYIVLGENGSTSSSQWDIENPEAIPDGIVLFHDIDGNRVFSIDRMMPGEFKDINQQGIVPSVYSHNNTNSSISWTSSSPLHISIGVYTGTIHALKTGSSTISANVTLNEITYSYSYNVKSGYVFGMSIQNNYPSSCEMGNSNYISFGLYADNISSKLISGGTYSLFDYRGTISDVNDLKNKNTIGATHTYPNMDDVDLMIYTGHGYARNRNEEEGLFLLNSIHFGNFEGQPSHPFGQGTIANANYTTQDALSLGNGTRTKWFVAYTCNFLNTEQNDPNVNSLLSNGGRLILGLASKSYIVAKEGEDFGEYLNEGHSIADAFFEAAHDNHDFRILLSKKRYRAVYYGEENAGTLLDTIMEPIVDIDYQETRIIDEVVNPYGLLPFEYY